MNNAIMSPLGTSEQLLAQAHIVDVYKTCPPDVPGWCADFAWLYAHQVLQAEDGAKFIEVGTWLGKSAIMMAQLIRASGKQITFWAIDHFRGSGSDLHHFAAILDKNGGTVRPLFEANLQRYEVRDLVRVIDMDSRQAAQRFADGVADFIMIDADHAYENVVADIQAWLPKVKAGGVMAGHDWNYMGVTQAVLDSLPGQRVWTTPTCWLYRKPLEKP